MLQLFPYCGTSPRYCLDDIAALVDRPVIRLRKQGRGAVVERPRAGDDGLCAERQSRTNEPVGLVAFDGADRACFAGRHGDQSWSQPASSDLGGKEPPVVELEIREHW